MHAQKDAQCWTAGWGDVTHYNEEPVQLQTLKVFLYNEDQCYNHSLDFTGGRIFNPEVEFCAGHWDGEGPGFKSYQ